MSKPVKRSAKDYVLLTIKGMAMGAADVVPGVSGGTIAFITGIYDELLYSLKNITPNVLLTLKNEGFVAAWNSINASFLAAVFGGILISLKTFAHLITVALDSYPILVWAFFFGLILASIYYFAVRQKGWSLYEYGACALGALFVFGVSIMAPTQLPGYWWMMFLGGFIAICAMILPGISGSFLLLLLGLYPAFLDAINTLDILSLASFGCGCIAGLLIFSRFLSWLMETYHKLTFAALIGFLIGSLNVVWPWKETLVTAVDRHGETIPMLQKNISPATYEVVNGASSMLFGAIACLVLGVALVLITEYVSSVMSKSSN